MVDLRGWRDAEEKEQFRQAQAVHDHGKKVLERFRKVVRYGKDARCKANRGIVNTIIHDGCRDLSNLQHIINKRDKQLLWYPNMFRVRQWTGIMEFILDLL